MKCLEKAGWRLNRHVDTTRFEAALRERGLSVSAPAIEFLSEFGGLALRYPHFRAQGREDGCNFLADVAAAGAQEWRIQEYEMALGSRLTVIGRAFSDHMTVVMDEGGRVYAGFEDVLVNVGKSGADALNALCEGREVRTIPYDVENEPISQTSAMLSEAAIKSLSDGGWYRNRSVLLPETTGTYRKDNIPRAATDFLREFQGVSMACPAWGNPNVQDLCLLTADATKSLPPAHYAEYNRKIGQSVAAIGELEKAQFVLLMGEDGRVFAGMRELPDILWLVGDSGYDAINNLCAGVPRKRYL
jgi:hypothetical protein